LLDVCFYPDNDRIADVPDVGFGPGSDICTAT
jgi:hypothetical protein